MDLSCVYILTAFWMLSLCFASGIKNLTLHEEEKVFQDYTQWVGMYTYNRKVYYYSMETELRKGGVVFGKFKDEEGATMDMSGTVFKGMRVLFSMTRVTKASEKFKSSSDFEFMVVGFLERHTVYKGWTYTGNVTLPKNGLFTVFTMQANNGKRLQTTTPVNTALRVGLTVGISLGLGILGVLLMLGVTVWAIRKGYLRHIPGSYSTFRNERTTYDAKENSLHI